MWTKESLANLIETKYRGYRLILVSNREPYSHQYKAGGVECTRPASGVTAALEPVMKALCRLDCKGLCPVCGMNRNQNTCNCSVEVFSPHMEKLLEIKRRLEDERSS